MFKTGDILQRHIKANANSADYYVVVGKKHNRRVETSLFVVGFYKDKSISTAWTLTEENFNNYKVVGHIDIDIKM